jgi:hypothetical protein
VSTLTVCEFRREIDELEFIDIANLDEDARAVVFREVSQLLAMETPANASTDLIGRLLNVADKLMAGTALSPGSLGPRSASLKRYLWRLPNKNDGRGDAPHRPRERLRS